MDVQKTAQEYLDLIRKMGFQVNPDAISKPYLRRSRCDFVAMEWFGFQVPEVREETLVNFVAVKIKADQVLQSGISMHQYKTGDCIKQLVSPVFY